MNDDQLHVGAVSVPDEDLAGYVEGIVRRSGSSFFLAMRRLSADKRMAMYAIYAFCRVVDDIADDLTENSQKMLLLGQWREEIERLYGQCPRDPITRYLSGPIEKFKLNKSDFNDVIDGMEMDSGERVRIANMVELEKYCDRVACSVGRLSNRIFGVPDPICDQMAFSLGQALQLTNILRDIYEDALIDRLYLPADVLLACGINNHDAKAVVNHSALPEVCDLLATIAERRFTESKALIMQCDPGIVRPATMMMENYRRILKKLKSGRWEHPIRRVKLNRLEKLWVFLLHGIF